MSDNEQIEKAFTSFDSDKYWIPEDRLENHFEWTYFKAGYKAGAKAERERIAGSLDILTAQRDTPLEFQRISAEYLDGLIRNSERFTAILKALKEFK